MSDEELPRENNDAGEDDESAGKKRHYDVGFCKPPRHTRFQPGQSGNPKGRPRGAKGLKSELNAELAEKVTITQDGKTKRLSKRRVIIKSLTAKAAKGDTRAADKVLGFLIQMQGFEDERPRRERLCEADQRILEHFLEGGSDTPPAHGHQGKSGVEDSEARDDDEPS